MPSGGSGGAVNPDNTGFVVTRGADAVAILAQRLGAGGGAAGGVDEGEGVEGPPAAGVQDVPGARLVPRLLRVAEHCKQWKRWVTSL